MTVLADPPHPEATRQSSATVVPLVPDFVVGRLCRPTVARREHVSMAVDCDRVRDAVRGDLFGAKEFLEVRTVR